MPNLRFLLFIGCQPDSNNVHLPDCLNSLSDDLIILKWQRYPLRALPSNFSPEKLVELDLTYSNIEQLWEGTKHAPKLKFLVLSNCQHLTRIPNLSDFLSLEGVYLAGCERLFKSMVPSSINDLTHLEDLNLSNCPNLDKLPKKLGNLKSLKELIVDGTAVGQLPSSITCLENLESLEYSECWGLTILHPLSGLCSLSILNLKKCNLKEIPEDIGCSSSLEWLDLRGNMFESLPKSIKHLSKLETLLLRDCNMLRSLTELPVSLQQLDAMNCEQLCQALPDASEFKRCITSKYHKRCITRSRWRCDQHKPLCQLCPPHYEYVKFLFINCFNLDQKAVSNVFEESLKGSEEPPTQFSIYIPGTEIPEWFTYQSFGFSVNIQVLRQDLVNRKLMGFAISAVLWVEEYYHHYNLAVDIYCHFETCDDHIYFPLHVHFVDPVLTAWDHILLGYSSFSKFLSSSQNLKMLHDNECDYVDILFKFNDTHLSHTFHKVKYCAVHPIYAKPMKITDATIEDIDLGNK